MQKFSFLIALILLCAGTGKGFYLAKDGFNARRVQGWEKGLTEIWDKEADLALSGEFHYIGRGRECFAFASEDDRYILKLPRTDKYNLPLWLRALPFKGRREKEIAIRASTQKVFLESLRISYEELKDLSALLAIHIGHTEATGRTLRIKDRLGRPLQLPLDKTSFVLQYKKPMLIPAFLEALKQGNQAKAEKILGALVEVVNERSRRQISNRDKGFHQNYGFDGEKAFQIDIGDYYKVLEDDHEFVRQKANEDTMNTIRKWLTKIDPQMAQFLEKALAESPRVES